MALERERDAAREEIRQLKHPHISHMRAVTFCIVSSHDGFVGVQSPAANGTLPASGSPVCVELTICLQLKPEDHG